MNTPKKLNGWTSGMMHSFKEAFQEAAKDEETKVIVFTGTGKYFSAGVNLSGLIKPMHPKKLHQMLTDLNRKLFEIFLDCPKPILVAMNGHAIGASVTSSTLCNGILASKKATFSTPFSALGITPEGCSSVHLPRLIGEENAKRMLGQEAWKPTAAEALEIGLVQWVVPDQDIETEAQRIAEEWAKEGVKKTFLKGSELKELKAVNERESRELADAFLSAPFLKHQAKFLWSKKKHTPAATFFTLWGLRPLWSLLL